MSRTVLIDGDVILYQAAASSQERHDWGNDVVSEEADLPKAQETFDRKIRDTLRATGADDYLICLSDRKNWRKDVLPTYKANRKAQKPLVYWDLAKYVGRQYKVRTHDRLEADDVLGMLMTGRTIPGERICATIDKDLRTVPGLHWNPMKPHLGVEEVKARPAAYFYLTQCLTGDTVDGYAGCPRVGKVKAEKLLRPVFSRTRKVHTMMRKAWPVIVAAYESKGLTEEDARVQAQVARILQYGEYDGRTHQVSPMTPDRF